MSKFNRGLYAKGTNMTSIEEIQKDAAKHDKKFYDDNGRVGYHSIEEGRNIFRVAVAHDPGDSPYVPIRFSNMEVEVDEYDSEGNKTGQKVWKRRKCFIATQHGPRDEAGASLLNSDVIETYIDCVTNKAKLQFSSEKEREQYLNPIHGYWHDGKFQWGIRPETKNICYAWDDKKELKQLELNKKWYSDMQSLIIGASANAPVAVDIFSHVDNGSPLVIEKNVIKEAGKRNKTEYKVTKQDPDMHKRESWDDFFKRTRITDKQLEELLEKKSLKELYVQNYTREEFERIVQGLRRFDAHWKFNMFMDQDFLQRFDEIEAEVMRVIPENKEEEEPAKEIPDQGQGTAPEVQTKDVKKITVPKMRKFLKEYVDDNYGSEYQLPMLKGEELKKWYELAVEGEDLPWDSLVQSGSNLPDPPDDLPWKDDDLDKQVDDIKNGVG